jgi:chromosome segregation ATPase
MPFVTRTRLAALIAAERDLIAHHDRAVACDEAQTTAAKAAAELRTQVRGLTRQIQGAEQWAKAEQARASSAARERDDLQKLADAAIAEAAAAGQRAQTAERNAEDLARQLVEAIAARAPQPAAMAQVPADKRVEQLAAALASTEEALHDRDAENQRLLRERDEARNEVARLVTERDTALGLVEQMRRDAPAWPINNGSTTRRGDEQ